MTQRTPKLFHLLADQRQCSSKKPDSEEVNIKWNAIFLNESPQIICEYLDLNYLITNLSLSFEMTDMSPQLNMYTWWVAYNLAANQYFGTKLIFKNTIFFQDFLLIHI